MKLQVAVAVLLCCCVEGFSGCAMHVGAQNMDRREVTLAQMDKASAQFKAARADFIWDYYQAAPVEDTTRQTGPIYFEHTAKGTQMGAVVVDAHGGKNKVLEYKDGLLRYWDVPNNQVRTLKAGSNQAQYESFLTLGFGGSGHDLEKAWTVTDMGQETMSDGAQQVKVEKLELVSKDPQVLKTFTHVTIWVDLARDVSLKQVFDTPTRDRRTAIYSHITTGGKVDAGTFKISDKAIKVQ